jgi:hypothetical protein
MIRLLHIVRLHATTNKQQNEDPKFDLVLVNVVCSIVVSIRVL